MLALLFLCLAGAFASPVCKYSDWGNWDRCKTNIQCQKPQIDLQTAPKEKNGQWMDSGRIAGEQMMAYKEELWSTPNLLRDTKQSQLGARVNCVNGLADGYACDNVDQMSFLNLIDLGGSSLTAASTRGNDNWGWTDPQTNDEYVVMGLDDGTSFVRMTDAENPVVVAFMPTATLPSSWRDMKVVNDHAFVVSEATGHGMQVFDLRRLRGQTDLGDVDPDFHYDLIGQSHNIIANPASNTVFVVGSRSDSMGCAAGLHMIDVSNPQNPQFAGCFGDDGYVHDAQCHFYNGPDARYRGREVCYCYNEDTLTLVDVTDKANPAYIGEPQSYVGYAYTHQGWVTEDHSVILLDDEQDESRGTITVEGNTVTYVWDVTDLENPRLENAFLADHGSIDHNQYIKGNLTYQSNYEVGLRILRIDQPNYALSEVGYFDVDDTSPGGLVRFTGSWSNYPYFASGNIPVTSIEYGLFIVRPNIQAMEATYQANLQPGTNERTRHLMKGNAAHCTELKETSECLVPAC